MRAWRRSRIRLACGRCGRTIEAGEPVLALTFATAPTSVLWRCAACCGPAPDNLPELIDAQPSSFVSRLKASVLASLPDWKKRAGGDD